LRCDIERPITGLNQVKLNYTTWNHIIRPHRKKKYLGEKKKGVQENLQLLKEAILKAIHTNYTLQTQSS